MLKAAGLWTKTSVKGSQYFTGRLGGVKMLILENRDRQSNDAPSHHLILCRGVRSAPKWPGTGRTPSIDTGQHANGHQ
jgi:hypothetical protein